MRLRAASFTVKLLGLGSVAAGILGFGAACSFGVNLDGIFNDASTGSDVFVEGGPPPMQASLVVSGDGFSCALRVDGTVTCWGSNGNGRLGNGGKFSSSTPVLVKDLTDASHLAAGDDHACAVRKSGVVSCWGWNEYRQLGDGTTSDSAFPVPVVGLSDAVQVAAGVDFSCALRKDATVSCWGDNAQGQLGDGTTTGRSQPAPVTGLANVAQIGTMQHSACALVKSGEVYCWGDNHDGQIGNGASPDDVLAPAKIASLTGVTAISTGAMARQMCAVLQSGEARCWGLGDGGALGNSGYSSKDTPVPVVALTDAVSVTTGSEFSCAVRKGGAASCWGVNYRRQLGLGDTSPPDSVSTPVPVTGVAGIAQLAAGDDHLCALLPGGKISCWGSDVDGRLGRGTRIYSSQPQKVVGLSQITSLSLGDSHGCAVAGGALSCWGTNEQSQLTGDNNIGASGTPLPIPSIPAGVTRTGSGSGHNCAIVGGEVRCWGATWDNYGQLGNGKSGGSDMPVVFGAGPATDVGGGYFYTCAHLTSGEVACAGLNDGDRLGQPGNSSNTPVSVLATAGDPDGGTGPTNLSGVTKLSVGYNHACVLVGTAVKCWGSCSAGQCGTPDDPAFPAVTVPLPGPAVDVAAGAGHTCAALQDGSVKCWGANGSGELGGNSSSGPDLRTPSLGGKSVKAVAAGSDHSCALATDGTVLCWGRGDNGQTGNTLRLDSPTPAVVAGVTNAVSVSAHGDTTCAVLQDGTALCWGDNSTGQLGEGSVFTTGVPASVVGY
jgi:alpha-tubulin suppressor-like RCC1 family protein